MKSGYTPRSVEGESTDAAEEYAALGSGQATANLARAVDEISGAIGTSAVSWFGPGSELGNMAQSDGGYDAKLAVVSPASTTDVQSLIRIASRCDCRLVLEGASGSISGPSPRQPSRAEIRVDLRRMNRIIAVDDARAYAIVEPGVTYFDLYEYLRAGSHDLAMLVPDEAGVSVLDHVLYRSSQRRWRRGDVSEACGLEVVLPSGEVVRTGDVHSHYVDPSKHLASHNNLEGILADQRLGVVTKLAVRLAHRPRRQIACAVRCVDESSLRPLLKITRRLMAESVLSGDITVTNLIATAARFSERTDWYKGSGPIPEALLEKIIKETGLGRWEMRFALVGSASVVRAQLDDARIAYQGAPGLQLTWHEYDGSAPGDSVRELDKIQAGIPSSFPSEQRQWYGAGSGQFEFTLATLAQTERAVEACNLIRASLHEYRLDYHAQLQLLPGATVQRCIVPFSQTIPGSQDWARAAVSKTLERARDDGLVICQSDVEIAEAQTDSSEVTATSLIREKLELTLDPRRVFSRTRPTE